MDEHAENIRRVDVFSLPKHFEGLSGENKSSVTFKNLNKERLVKLETNELLT